MAKTKLAMVLAAGLAFSGWAAVSVQAQPAGRPVPPDIAAAVSDPSRPEADRARDADRHPAEMVEFAGIRPGDKVADLLPGGGYFTRIFAKAVGPRGHVFAWTLEKDGKPPSKPPATEAIAAEPGYSNVTVLVQPAFRPPEKLDVVWTSQNYHDLHNIPGLDVIAFDRSVYAALKPGGVFVVLDHAAPGTGLSATNTLHRIDPAIVRQEAEKAGFVFDGESDVLRNPADLHTAKVFDPAIRGHTDQFIYRFRKRR